MGWLGSREIWNIWLSRIFSLGILVNGDLFRRDRKCVEGFGGEVIDGMFLVVSYFCM